MGLGQQDSNDNREWGLDFGAGNPEEQKIHDLGVGCEWFGERVGEKFSGEMGHTDHLSYSYLVWESPVWIIRKLSSGSQTFSSVAQSCPTLWTAACQAFLSITNSWSLLKLMSFKSVCHPTISSSVVPFSCLQSFPSSGSFQMSQFFTSGGQSIEVSASASVLPMNIQDWFPSGLTGLIS